MKEKNFKENYSKKAKKKPIRNKRSTDYKWVISITIMAFLISFVLSFASEFSIASSGSIISIIVILICIIIGLVFDMVGIAITVADVSTFNSMATKNVRGASLASKLARNASKASNFCSDVIGDICGIISGSAGIALALSLSSNYGFPLLVTMITTTSIIAAITIGGKALGKAHAINKSTYILYQFAKIVAIFYRK